MSAPAAGNAVIVIATAPGDAGGLAAGEEAELAPGDAGGLAAGEAGGLAPGDAAGLAAGEAGGLAAGDAAGDPPLPVYPGGYTTAATSMPA